jgi:uncharacterized protein involved in outer membrane biogenesis
MKKFFSLLAVFLLFMCAVAGAFILMPPVSWAKYLIVKGVRDTSGLDIKINGKMSLSLVPSIRLRMEDVVLANPADPPDRPFITARVVEVHSFVRPLIAEERRIETVTLTEPRIDAAIGKDGRASWQSAGPARTRSTSPASSHFLIQTLEANGATISFRDEKSGTTSRIEGAKIIAREVSPARFTEAVVEAANAAFGAPATGNVELGQVAATASEFQAGRLRELSANGATLRWRQPGQDTAIALAAEKFALKAAMVGMEGTGPVAFSGGSVRWRDASSGATVTAAELAATARTAKPGRLEDVTAKSAALALNGGSTRAGAAAGAGPTMLADVSFASPVLASATPIDAAVGLVWNKERVTGKVRLPSPDALGSGMTLPANLSLAAAGGNLDFDGTIDTASGLAKGRTKAGTASLEGIARWLGLTLPAGVRGTAGIDGDIEASATRIALANGRLEHAGNAMTGALTIETSGARPRLAGRLSGDRINADPYVGAAPAKRSPAERVVKITPPVSVNDALKVQLRAMLDAQPRRTGGGFDPIDVDFSQFSPRPPSAKSAPGAKSAPSAKSAPNGFEWSEERFDLTALRTVDLDIDLSIKELAIRGFTVNVPRLKTQLKDGALALEGSDLATRGAQFSGKLSGKAEIDVRQPVPFISTTFKADGIDVEEVSEAFGIPVMLAGNTSLEGNLTSTGRSQRELVEGLSGKLRSRMAQGHVVGYDFTSVLAWVFGNREYDPSRRTPITRLNADLNLDKGVARESQVDMDGPIIGATAEGSMRLIDQEIDYRARIRLSSWFRAISLRIFGDWSQPSVSPDLGSVFTRSGGPGGDGTLADALAGVDVTDPELATLIGQVIERTGQRGLDPLVGSALKSLQERALRPR